MNKYDCTDLIIIIFCFVLQVNFTSLKQWIKLREVLEAEIIFISLLFSLLSYQKKKRNKKKKKEKKRKKERKKEKRKENKTN